MSDLFFTMTILILFLNSFVSLFSYFTSVEWLWLYFACLIVLIGIKLIFDFIRGGRKV